MNEFNQSWMELEEFLKSEGNSNPSGIISMIRTQLKSCILPSSSSTNLHTFKLSDSEMFGVQQFVNKFGCHLEFQHTGYDFFSGYQVVPNWKK